MSHIFRHNAKYVVTIKGYCYSRTYDTSGGATGVGSQCPFELKYLIENGTATLISGSASNSVTQLRYLYDYGCGYVIQSVTVEQ